MKHLASVVLFSLTATLATPAAAQPGGELVLQLNGQSVLEHELQSALRKVSLPGDWKGSSFIDTGARIDGWSVIIPGGGAVDAPTKLDRVRELLPGYAVSLELTNGIRAELTDAALAKRLDAAGEAAAESARSRLANAGYTLADVQRPNATQLLVTLPAGSGKTLVEMASLLTTPGIMTLNVATNDDPHTFELGKPVGRKIAFADDTRKGAPRVVNLHYLVTNSGIAKADLVADQSGKPAIALEMTPEAAKIFGDQTPGLIGRTLAIVIDGRIISTPVLMTPLTGKQAVLTGSFSLDEADQLVTIFNSKPMPARLDLLETRARP